MGFFILIMFKILGSKVIDLVITVDRKGLVFMWLITLLVQK